MAKRNQTHQQVPNETAELKNRLAETEETLHAIRQYLVDAFVITRADGEQVVTLSDADFPYRMMVEAMNEGAVTLVPDGTIFYCNPRFAEMVQMEAQTLIGVRFHDLVAPEEQSGFEMLFKHAGQEGARGEFHLKTVYGNSVLAQLSVYQLAAEDARGTSVIATDITERVQAAEKIRSLASKLTIAEQQERHRISQILHDDLQQRLFAIKAQLTMLNGPDKKNNLPSDVQADLAQLQDWLSETINITRSLSIDISPVVLQGEGLTESLTWLASQMKEQYGLQVELESKADFRHFDNHMRVLLFQTVRELLFNVVKHAGILQAEVILEQIDHSAFITVRDKGKGFDMAVVMNDPEAAHGLLSIQNRLNLIGSSMEVTSAPGAGTTVVIEVPLVDSG
jgi:PAS domain S-box-containing protein